MFCYEDGRTRRVEFLVNDEEYERLEELARQAGLDLGTYVRCSVLYDTTDTVRGFVPPGALEPSQLQRIVVQALDRVVSPTERELVIQSALTKAACATMPDGAAELTAFVFGPLRDSVEGKIGNDKAERMLVSLTPLLKQACKLDGPVPERTSANRPSSRPPSSSQPRATPRTATSEPSRSGTILLVEHDARARAQLAQLLRAHGYEVFTAPDGHVALAVTMRNRPDLVVAAKALPMVGGRQLIALLRVAFAGDAPPVLLISDEDAPGEPVEGAVSVLQRSLGLDQVLKHIGEVLPLGESPRKRR